jgi:lysozyme family protein
MNISKKIGIIIFIFTLIFILVLLEYSKSQKRQKTKTDIFETAIEFVLNHEGKYVNDIDDKGGETKYGISKQSYPNVDIKNLSIEKAKEIYRKDFWESQNYKKIHNDDLAIKIFDLSVNTGSKRANKLIQRALRAVGKKVQENGILNDVVICLINESDPTDLLAALKSEAAGYYRTIVNTKPKRAKFLNGWLNRAYK